MTDQKIPLENQAEKESVKFPNEKERVKISALSYVEHSLADPNYGDARRDELALAALAASIGHARRSK